MVFGPNRFSTKVHIIPHKTLFPE